MADELVDDARRRAEEIMAKGREGLSRAEIAAALRVTVAALEALAAEDAGLAAALEQADAAAWAWWEGLPREAMRRGAPFNQAAWARAMRQRFGAAALERAAQGVGALGGGGGDDGSDGAAAQAPVVTVHIPDNGRWRGPDGWSPCDGGERARQWDLKQVDGEIRELERDIREASKLLAAARERREEILNDTESYEEIDDHEFEDDD